MDEKALDEKPLDEKELDKKWAHDQLYTYQFEYRFKRYVCLASACGPIKADEAILQMAVPIDVDSKLFPTVR